MSEHAPNPGAGPQGSQPVFDPEEPNQQRPKLRPVRGFPAKHGEQTLLALADAQQISQRIVFTMPAAQAILPHMTGEKDLDTIVSEVGRGLTREMLEQFVAQLDEACLIEGPKRDALMMRMRAEFDSTEILPPATTAQMADALVEGAAGEEAEVDEEQKRREGPERLATQFDTWIDEALKDVSDPAFDALPRAIVAPHLDYPRGWLNYAHAYGRLRVVEKPDRVVILGTNHFGAATGVCGCDKGFETPLGVSPAATDVKEAVERSLGEAQSQRLYHNRFDHEREHSIELQVAWLQHIFGEYADDQRVPVWAALVHDPARNNGESYDGQGLGLLPFVAALKEALGALPGRTLIVASADLSHVGPQFGDQQTLAGDEEQAAAMRNKVIQHDREMLGLFSMGKGEELVASMAWQQNPTRWCSVGNMVAALQLTDAGPEDVRMLHYAAAMDPQGMGLVSSCAAAIF